MCVSGGGGGGGVGVRGGVTNIRTVLIIRLSILIA